MSDPIKQMVAKAAAILTARSAPIAGTGCIEMAGAKYGGYARVKIAGRSHQAHRLAWQISRGPIPAGMMVCHRCDNRCCINVDHLFLGTAKDNYDDSRKKGRAWMRGNTNPARGEAVSTAKITYEIAQEIRAFLAKTPNVKAASRKYGLGRLAIRDIREWRTWKSPSPPSKTPAAPKEHEVTK